MKRSIIVFILAILLMVILTLYITVSDYSMIDEMYKIVKCYGSSKSSVRLLEKDELEWLSKSSQTGFKLVDSMTNSDMVVDISFMPEHWNHMEQPNEIYAIFECWLKLHEMEQTNISAITCSYSSGRHFDYDTYLIVIPRKAFIDSYNKLDLTEKTQSDIACELAEIWMHKNMYNRQGLIFDEQDEHIKMFVTPWNTSQVSPDGKFVLSCDYSNYGIKVQKITKYKGISSLYDIWNNKTDEQEYLYGVWDDNNNFLIYGENEVKLFEYDGASGWEEQNSYG